MKPNAFVFVALCVASFLVPPWVKGTEVSVPHYLCETLAPTLRHPLADIVVSFPSQVVLMEGQQSMPYSSVRGESDYFVVPTSHTNGGRILRMTPLSTSNDRPWYGIEDTSIVFTDHLSGEVFTTPLSESTNSQGARASFATVTIDNLNIYVVVEATLTPRYPGVTLTWGLGATYWNPGSEIDHMQCPSDPLPVPSNSVVTVEVLRKAKGQEKYAHVLKLEGPLHASQRLEYSDKGISWLEIPRNSLFYTLDLTEVLFRDAKRRKYFRVVSGTNQ
jgi:hypothetical protein